MSLIRFVAGSSKHPISKASWETVMLSSFPQTFHKRIRQGNRSFLIGPVEKNRTTDEVAQVVAGLKMKKQEADFHFIGKTI